MRALTLLRRLAVTGLALAGLVSPRPALAQATSPTTITVTGGAQPSSQTAPTGQVQFGLRVPLKPNAENVLTLVAADQLGQTATVNDLKIAQITLTDVVRAKVTATRLTTPEIRQLVAQGVIDIADPANYNVSRFVVVLTVGGQTVQVPVPVVRRIEETFAEGPPVSVGCGNSLSTTANSITIPCGGGGGGGSAQDTPPLQIIPFEAAPAGPGLPSIPGVIIIEGRIKTLKEFFKVDLLLMNVSSIFTLTELTARLDVPAGDLTPIAPAGGAISIPDLTPGTDVTGNFIIRGDTKGVHTVTAHFGGKIVGSFLPAPVPFSGSASTDLEVKGAPKLDVRVSHPDFVTAGVPYDLTVTIENTDPELDALYASMALDVGAGANLLDEVTGQQIDGPVARSLGDILKGQSITQTYKVMPLTTGAIISCVGAADANINLSVAFVGNGPGCAIGTLPSTRTSPDGKPTVTVVPAHNTTGVNPATAIVALFSDQMIEPTITAGYAGASFTVESATGGVVTGTLSFADIFGGTSAIFQPTSPLAPDTQYTITVNPSVFNTAGLSLASGIVARFTTSSAPPAPDTTAPAVTLAVDAPFTATAISRGQTVPMTAQATDGTGVARVDLLLDGALIDAKRAAPSLTFLVDTATLAAGSSHVLEAQAYDFAGNIGTTSVTLQIAPDQQPPVATIVANAAVGQGRVLPIAVQATDDGRVARVEVFLDSATTPFATGLVEPFQFSLDTTGVSGGAHVLRAVVEDGAGNTSQATANFTITADNTPPVVALLSPQGTAFRAGSPVPFAAQASDDTAVATISFTLDAETTPRGVGDSFTLDTTGLALGPHVMTVVAADASNNQATLAYAFTLTVAPVDTTPPPPVSVAALTLSTVSPGIVAIAGGAGAAEVGARVVFTNQSTQAGANAVASATGTFAVQIDAVAGDIISVVAIDDAGNTSTPVTVTVPSSATLTSIAVSPSSVALSRSRTSEPLGVVGTFSDNSQQVLTSGLTFTSSAPTVASVTSGGLVLPGANGSAVVTVDAGSGVAPVQVPVTVNFSSVVGLSAAPSPVTLNGLGANQRLTVTALYSDSTTGPFGGTVRFATANPAVAIVDGAGLVTATGIGTTTISLASTGLPTIQVLVTVSPVQITGIIVSPTSVSLTALGQTAALAVQFQYSDGTVGAGTAPITYQSLDAAIAAVSGAGVVTAAGEGTTSIVVAAAGFVDNVAVSVTLPSTLPPPVITSLGRPIVAGGDTLVVLGLNFAGTPAQNFATINGQRATVLGADNERLILQVPQGATTGPVVVRVAGQSSNAVAVDIYARLGRTQISALPFQATPGAGQSVAVGSATFYWHPGDTAVVSADPNTIDAATWTSLQPPVVTGRLVLTVNGADVILTPSGQPIDITSFLPSVTQPTLVTLALRVEETGGTAAAGPLALIAGPANTGAFAGVRYTTGNTIGEQTVIRFRTASPDGTKFAVTSQNWYRLDGQYGNGSQGGGSFVGSDPTPNDSGFRTYTAQGGEVVVTYDDAGVFADFGNPGQIVIAMVPADANGSRLGTTPVAEARIVVTALASATVVPQQTSVLADGVNRPVAVDVNSVRDSAGNPAPDGTVLALTVRDWYRRSDGGFGNGSAGGALSGGVPTPNDQFFRSIVLAGGAGQLVYTVNGAALGAGTADTVVFAALTGFPNGSRVALRPFAEGTMARSAPSVSGGNAVAVPSTLSAVSSDNRSVITISGLTDSLGNVVPDGTMVAATAALWYRMSDGQYGNGSFGGTILGGITSPNDQSFRAFPVQGGSVTFTYSNAGLVLDDSATATTVVAVLPASGNGSRIGTTPLAEVRIAQGGLTTATIVATPASTVADGARRPVAIAITNLRDALGNFVPDGTRVALTAADWYRASDGQFGNGSAGGTFLDGVTTPNDLRFRTFTVTNGRIDATYSAESVSPFGPNDFRSAVISAVVADPAASRTTVVPFATGAVSLSSAQVGQITASPVSLYTDTQSRTSSIAMSGLTDGQGVPVPDGTNIAITAANWYRPDGNFGNGSLGGSMAGGVATPNDGNFRTYTVAGGAVTATYSNFSQFVDVGGTATAVISVLPATPTANRVGVVPLTTTAITLAGADTGTVLGAATVAPGGSLSLTLTNLRDTAGNLIPDGAQVAISAVNWYDRAGNFGNGSAGGAIGGGAATPNDGNFRTFTVSGGQVTFTFTATSALNTTAVISVLPASGTGNRLALRPFITHAVRVQ